MTATLWPHQIRAVEFVRGCWGRGSGALLALEMGTGKTRCALELVAAAYRVLVLCPKSVRATWRSQAAQWLPAARVTVLDGSGAQRAQQLAAVLVEPRRPAAEIVVTNYETLAASPSVRDMILRTGWDLLICDECHRVKAPTGATSKAVAKIHAPRRLGLSGTPMPHSPLDIWAQARALHAPRLGPVGSPHLAASFTRFRATYAVTVQRPGIPVPIVVGFRNQPELAAACATWTYHVAAADVLTLPEVIDSTVPVDLSGEEWRQYRALRDDLVLAVRDGTVTVSNALDRVLKLQQATGGTIKVTATGQLVRVGVSKRDALQEILEDLPPTEPVVVFARFLGDLDAIAAAAGDAGRQTLELSGRRNELAAWQGGGATVLAVQIQAGGVGVDLTRAAVCVYYSVGHSLGDYLQSRARVHRPGQTRTTRYLHLVATNTIDETIARALVAKRDIVEAVIEDIRRNEQQPVT